MLSLQLGLTHIFSKISLNHYAKLNHYRVLSLQLGLTDVLKVRLNHYAKLNHHRVLSLQLGLTHIFSKVSVLEEYPLWKTQCVRLNHYAKLNHCRVLRNIHYGKLSVSEFVSLSTL